MIELEPKCIRPSCQGLCVFEDNYFFLFQENSTNFEVVEQTYRRNPILRYTQHPLHSPLLPLPYGDVSVNCEYFTQVTESTHIRRVSEEPERHKMGL